MHRFSSPVAPDCGPIERGWADRIAARISYPVLGHSAALHHVAKNPQAVQQPGQASSGRAAKLAVGAAVTREGVTGEVDENELRRRRPSFSP